MTDSLLVNRPPFKKSEGLKMKKLFLFALAVVAMQAQATEPDCIKTDDATLTIPQDNIYELCFKNSVQSVALGSPGDMVVRIDNYEAPQKAKLMPSSEKSPTFDELTIPKSYKEQGVNGLVSITMLKSGFYTNIKVDTIDGARHSFNIIATDNKSPHIED